MKITVEHKDVEENEIILRCKKVDDEMLQVLTYLKSQSQRLYAYNQDNEATLLICEEIYYCESVDEKVFLYTEQQLYRTTMTLMQLESLYSVQGFFRISKSMIVNLYKIHKLKSYTSGRIELLMKNNEKIIVSRRYASLLRQKLNERSL
ncbi:MAG: LytTR family DNA-binding domain-containing protein [Coprobacillus sp.]